MLRSLRATWRSLCLALSLLLLLSSPAARAGQAIYPAMLVFGDSLSDTGNDLLASSARGLVPAIPPSITPYATYWQGRFTNGPVAVEYLWRLMARRNALEVAPSLSDPTLTTRPAVSFAFGGSSSGLSTVTPMGIEVPGLLGQVALFNQVLAGRRAPSRALYVVWSGANDYLQMLSGSPAPVVGNVDQAIRALYAAGARDFLVPNLANMGSTPFAQAQGLGPQFKQLSRDHNALLKLTLAALERELRQARIVTVDVYGLGEAIASSDLVTTDVPALEYLAPGSGAADCLFRSPATCVDVSTPHFVPPFLFWDLMHPTTQVHGIIGRAMFRALLTQR